MLQATQWGGGNLYVDGVTVMTGATFMRSRNDYGSTFRGNVYIKDSVLEAYKSHTGGELDTSKREGTTYVYYTGFSYSNIGFMQWDFGYKCYMPINITIDNFKSNGTGKTYVFENIKNYAFDSEVYSNAYSITKGITFRNMDILPTISAKTTSADYTEMHNITVNEE